MDDDYDELMGPAPGAMMKRLAIESPVATTAALISPDTTPTNSSRSAARPPIGAFGNSGGPPSTAFTNHTPDRWAQYENDSHQLQKDSLRASATAVAAVADRVAKRQMDMDKNNPVYSPDLSRSFNNVDINDRLSRAGTSLPHSEEKKSFSFASRGRTNNNSRQQQDDTISYGSDADRVRAEAMKVLEMAGGDDNNYSPYSLRKTKSGGYTTESFKGKRTPSALAGLQLKDPKNASKSISTRRTQDDRRFTIGSDSEGDFDDDLVDIINLENRVATSRKSPGINDASDLGKKSWSSRYSVDSRLMNTNSGQGNDSAQKILDDMDQVERERLRKSSRNMSWSSPYGDKNNDSPNIFGRSFIFKGNLFSSSKLPETPSKTTNLQSIWMDVDLQKNGNSLSSPPTSMKHRGPQSLDKARKRRRMCIAIAVAVCLCAIFAGVFGAKGDDIVNGANNALSAGSDAVTFYVTSDAPYTLAGGEKLQRDLISLVSEAAFIVHLGNVQDAFVTLCPETSYFNAKAILKTSPVPAFVLPGPDDWNNCPNPKTALDDWRLYLNQFENNFKHDFKVDHQLGNDENFSFLTSGVLFLGLHLVGGRIDDKDLWRVRHAKNAEWVEEQLSTYKDNSFRAVVLLGNARPSQQQEDFFSEIIDDIKKSGKPFLYIHANHGNGYDAESYVPFKNAGNLIALQIRDGGKSPPMKVIVGEGRKPFIFDLS